MSRPLTRRQRGFILAAVAVLTTIGLVGWRRYSTAALDDDVRRLTDEARLRYAGFDVQQAHLAEVTAGLDPTGTTDASALPALDGAELYRADFSGDGTEVRVTYWISRGWIGQRCVFVTAAQGAAPDVSDGHCPTNS